jgi:phage FluMu gp28-like protein
MAGKAGQNYWWVAPVYTQAEIAYRRMKRGIPVALYRSNDTDKWIELVNGARMWFRSAEKPDNLYGEDVYAAVIDEASRCREESWHAVRSTLTKTEGPIRIIGNVKGRKNWAYKLARRAEAGAPGMVYRRITAHDAIKAGILSQDEVEAARRDLPEAVFRELYLAEPSDDEGNPFGIAAIRSCLAPVSTKPALAWGWDLAKSVDWTVGIALDENGVCCRFLRFQKPWTETLEVILRETGRVPASVDATGVGDPIVETLQRRGGQNFEGFKFSAASKQQLMEGLAVAIQQQSVLFPEGPIQHELEQFEFVYSRTGVRYSAPEGLHDDCVMALALALHKRGRPVSRAAVIETGFY